MAFATGFEECMHMAYEGIVVMEVLVYDMAGCVCYA